MKKLTKHISFRCLTALSLAALLFFYHKASALENEASDTQIAQKIEDVLLFDEGLKQSSDAKSDLTFNPNKSHDVEENQDSTLVEIIVNEKRNVVNSDIRNKEKIAYNAANAKQYEAAIELFKQVIDAEPDNYYATFSLATIYQKLGQFRQSKGLYYKLLQNHPENKEEIINNVLSLMIEESPQASIYVLSKLAAQNPNSPYILARSALAFSKVKKYEQAVNYMKQAISLDPSRLDYKYNLAVIYDQAQIYEKALSAYNEVVRGYNGNEYAAAIPLEQVRKRIETIKNKV